MWISRVIHTEMKVKNIENMSFAQSYTHYPQKNKKLGEELFTGQAKTDVL